jgi:hypothetical protein
MPSKRDLLGGVLGGAVALLTGHAPGCDCSACAAGVSFGAGLARGAAKVAARRAGRRKGRRGAGPVGELPAVAEVEPARELVERGPVAVEVVVTSVRELPPPRRG